MKEKIAQPYAMNAFEKEDRWNGHGGLVGKIAMAVRKVDWTVSCQGGTEDWAQ